MMSKMLEVCVYCDSTNMYTDEEINKDNLTYMLFPEKMVMAWYYSREKEFVEETAFELGISEEDCNFQRWFDDVYTADDTDGLYNFAKQRGFAARRMD